jgi:acyl phosphate:glycerol-3-phosphate acyltransferase
MLNINYVLIPAISYLLGSIPFSLYLVKLFFKKDLREDGSRNMGAMNTLRIVSKEKNKALGILFFLLVFALDALKGIAAVILAIELLPGHPVMAATLATFFAVLGHNYSALLNLKGGRGAATMMGIILFLDRKAFFAWLVIVLIFMILFELPIKKKLNFSIIKHAVSENIIGRLAGEIMAVAWIYFYDFKLFYPVFFATLLVLLAHKDRIRGQIEKMKDKTY